MARRTVVFATLLAMLVVAAAALLVGWDRTADPSRSEATPADDAATPGALAWVAVPELRTPVVPTTDATNAEAAEDLAHAEEPAEPRFPFPNENAQPVRLVIPRAKVNHRFVVRGLNAKREMEDPGGKDDVAWYDFSSLPGFGSNAVLSGHVDWYTGERGVFWFLRDLKEGDEAEVHYSDGMVLKYRVVRVEVYGVNEVPVAEITGPTSTDMLTMITCDGVFQRSTRDYTQRRVVFAERVG